MPFQKGQSGNPGGRPKELMWRNALQMAITQKTGKPLAEALAEIAGGLVDHALAGDMAAIREIADRVDGKPSAHMHLNHEASGFLTMATNDVSELLISLSSKVGKEEDYRQV